MSVSVERVTGAIRRRVRWWFVPKRPAVQVFNEIYQKKAWGEYDSVSGPGSDMADTEAVRAVLPALLKELGVKSMLDVPCGDFFWMQHVNIGATDYIGGDIVAELAAQNQQKFGRAASAGLGGRLFQQLNIITDALPKVDLIMCRDCLVHLPLKEGQLAMENFRTSGAKWLLTTTFPGGVRVRNGDIEFGDWRPLDLTLPPYSMPPAERLIDEKSRFSEFKRLGLWRINP